MVPEGWKLLPLEALVSFTNGKAHESDVTESGQYILVNSKFISSEGQVYKRTNKAFCPANTDDVLMVMSDVPNGRAIAKCFYVLEDNKYTVNQRIARLRAVNADSKFLFYTINRNSYYLWFDDGITQTNLRKDEVLECPIRTPPLPEQKKIAQILSTWDQAITATERLLENSQQRKKALMQQLLTGKKRLPGFEGEWEKITLGSIGKITSAGVDKNIVDGEKPVRLLNYLDVFRREFLFNNEFKHTVTAPDRKISNCDVRKGDVFFTPSSETRDEVGIPAVAAEDMPGVVYSYHVVRFRPVRSLDVIFSAYVFQTDKFRRQTYRLCDGSGQRYVLSQDGFRGISFKIPDVTEQRAIGQVLECASLEISALRDRLVRLKAEKKALMQQLLTGKRRVRVDSEAA